MNDMLENKMLLEEAEEPKEPEYDKERHSDILVNFISNIDKLFTMNRKQAE